MKNKTLPDFIRQIEPIKFIKLKTYTESELQRYEFFAQRLEVEEHELNQHKLYTRKFRV